MKPPGDPEELARQKEPGCTCPHHFRSLGTLYGVHMGFGWTRAKTDRACPAHGDNSYVGWRPERGRRR